MTRRTVREKWAAAVLASDLNNATKVVMWALYQHMDEYGRVRHRRDDLADECNLANARRVSDRIREAKDKGFLTARSGGVNGQVVQYYAELPGSQRQGPSSTGRGGGLQGPSNRDPQVLPDETQGPCPEDPYACAPLPEPAAPNRHRSSAASDVDHDVTSQAGSCGSGQPTPSKRLSLVTRTEVA